MNWFEIYYQHATKLPSDAQVSILLALSWAQPISDAVVVIEDLDAKAAHVGFTGRILPGLHTAAAAGWLAPIEVREDGSLRTRLTLPVGLVA